MATKHRLTDEQVDALDTFRNKEDMIIQAGAGSGKTWLLLEMARQHPKMPMLFTVYNKAAQLDAQRRAPKNIECRTRHSLAYRDIGRKYSHRNRKGRIPASELAKKLGIKDGASFSTQSGETTVFYPHHLASLVMETVGKFCSSDAEQILPSHVPNHRMLIESDWRILAVLVAEYANKFWMMTIKPTSTLWFEDDYYFKIWLLMRPNLPYGVVMLDEAQDSTPAMRQLVTSQHAQKIAVGDAAQALYGWTGAVNIMKDWPGVEKHLTMSFRFGPEIAEEANVWLEHTGTNIRIEGNPAVKSKIASLPDDVDAVLCRSNGMCIQTAVEALDKGRKVGFSKDPGPLKRLAWGAYEMKSQGHSSHEDFAGFGSWKDVVEHSETPEGKDLKILVQLSNRFPGKKLPWILGNVVDASQPNTKVDLVVATAHSTKGLEWPRVRIAPDFTPPDFENGERLKADEAMVGYVAVTRAQNYLDNEGLTWIHTMPAPEPVVVKKRRFPSLV